MFFLCFFWPRSGRYHNSFVASHVVTLALGTANCTVNFFVFFSRSRRFRDGLAAFLPCFRFWVKEGEGTQTVVTTTTQRSIAESEEEQPAPSVSSRV